MPGQIRMREPIPTLATPWFDYLFGVARRAREVVEGTGWRVAKILSDDELVVAVLEKDG
jgi:hypothetical protein